jgi:hypothetical protein
MCTWQECTAEDRGVATSGSTTARRRARRRRAAFSRNSHPRVLFDASCVEAERRQAVRGRMGEAEHAQSAPRGARPSALLDQAIDSALRRLTYGAASGAVAALLLFRTPGALQGAQFQPCALHLRLAPQRRAQQQLRSARAAAQGRRLWVREASGTRVVPQRVLADAAAD